MGGRGSTGIWRWQLHLPCICLDQRRSRDFAERNWQRQIRQTLSAIFGSNDLRQTGLDRQTVHLCKAFWKHVVLPGKLVTYDNPEWNGNILMYINRCQAALLLKYTFSPFFFRQNSWASFVQWGMPCNVKSREGPYILPLYSLHWDLLLSACRARHGQSTPEGSLREGHITLRYYVVVFLFEHFFPAFSAASFGLFNPSTHWLQMCFTSTSLLHVLDLWCVLAVT